MIPFDITVTHSCGHQEQHTGATATGDVQSMVDFHSKRKCSACRPTCAYCHRVGDRENMLVTDTAVFCNDWCHQQSLKPSHYREHNDIQIPGFLRHWMDSSWHNDTCGSSMYTLREGSSSQPQVDIRVWVERADPADRDDPACDRFTIEVLDDGDNEHGLLWAGDDAAVAVLKSLREARSPLPGNAQHRLQGHSFGSCRGTV